MGIFNRRRHDLAALALLAAVVFGGLVINAQYQRKTLVAHRGASAYAPEHTLAAYKLALEQGADFVEQDLQITKDGILVCLHDLTLERTTNVEEIFPERHRVENGTRTWPVSDFTTAEIAQLDAGLWFDAKFTGTRVPTWQEAIDLVRGKAGLFPETKGPEVYGSRGFDMEALVLAQLEKNGLAGVRRDPNTPVIIQSFSPESLQKMAATGTQVPLVLLISDQDRDRDGWLSDDGLKRAKAFAVGIGPAKTLLLSDSTLSRRAHAAGLTVTPYTFRAGRGESGQTVKDEMSRFLYDIGVDAVFTDNPDQFPRR